jgi:Protein of unknown function (DUF2877)
VTSPRVLFAAPAAGRALTDGRVGVVEQVLSRGAYLRLEQDWLMLAEPGAPFGPLSLGTHGLRQMELTPGSAVRVSGGELIIGDHPISIVRMRERRVASLTCPRPAPIQAIIAAAGAALGSLPTAPARLRRGIAALASGRLRDGTHELAGLGEGLTPAGDDVLAGFAAWIGAPGLLSGIAAGRSSPLGLAYLKCAERGELPDVGAQLLTAIRSGSLGSARAAVPGVRTWGATSGVALGWGIAAAAKASTIYDSEQ